jgi:glycosyltransferase involved in cell wall biosynthesis
VRPRQAQPAASEAAAPGIHEVLMRGLPIPNYPHLRMGVPSKRTLVKLWSRHRPDVVHLATEGPLGWSALEAARHLRLPVTSDFRTNFHAYSRFYGIGWLHRPIVAYLRKFHNRTACTLVPTEALRAELTACGFERVHVVPRGVDTQRFSPLWRSPSLRAAWGLGPQDLAVGYVGRLAAEKNLRLLAETYRALRGAQPRARLVLVGDGPMRAELQAACPDAIFAGQRSGADLAAHYASMDLFLFPSLTETFGNVTTEALASGLPLVAFRHAAAGLLVRDGDNGLLAPCDDPEAFIAAARTVATDAALRDHLGPRARATASTLGWDAVVASFEQHLAAACGRPLTAPAAALPGITPAAV